MWPGESSIGNGVVHPDGYAHHRLTFNQGYVGRDEQIVWFASAVMWAA
jgi:hypothetical protein